MADDLEKEKANCSRALQEKDNLLEEKMKERIADLCKENQSRLLALQKGRHSLGAINNLKPFEQMLPFNKLYYSIILLEKDTAVARAEHLQQQVKSLEQDSLNLQKVAISMFLQLD